MKKKTFMVGQVYDLGTQSLVTIQQQVQSSLDQLTGGAVQFQIQQVSNNELELIFYRNFNYPATGQGMIYEFDAVMITGCGLSGFTLPSMWWVSCRGLSNRINFYIPVADFLQCYKQSAAALKASRTKDIQLSIQPNKVVMKLTY